MVKKLLVLGLTATLVAGALVMPAEAKKKTKRTERTAEATYYGATIGACYAAENIGCTRFPTTPKDKYLSIEIADTLQTTVYARVFQDLDGSGPTTEVASICGRNEEPIPITPGATVVIFIWGALLQGEPGPVDCPGAVSSGTIKMAFSNLP